MGYMEEINNAAKEIEVTVKSRRGTKDNDCKCCASWLAHWTQHTGFTPSWCRGCEAKLSAKDLVGGHVIKVNDADHKWYVVPLCKACNNSAPFEFNVKLKDLIWVDKCEKKSNLVYSILKNKASERK